MIIRLTFPANILLTPKPQCLRFPSYLGVSFFSNTCLLFDNVGVNHYEVLQLKPDCTHAELKRYVLWPLQCSTATRWLTQLYTRQFYALSRNTHPDMNPNDAKASERFAQLSESYSVLANPEK